jgi:DNA primase
VIEASSIEKLRENVDIIDVIGSRLELKKAGMNFKAKCPFHEEKSASFVVSPQKQIYHCFGCGAGGNVFSFIQNYDGLSFPEAVENLAEKHNFQLEYSEKSKFEEVDKLHILETLNSWFVKNLENRKDVLEYLRNRGISTGSISKFQLGYVPTSYEVLKFLKLKNISFSDADEVGVVSFGEDGSPYSRFVERLTFPIFSQSGKVIAFGGRTLSNHPAKYINSPTTKYFNKSKTLYGYNFAKSEVFRKSEMIFAEGYLDVIAMQQAGIRNVVAPLGTAFTKEHLPLLRRVQNLKTILAFDGDKAGKEAIVKALDILLPESVECRVVLFPKGIDPADLVKDKKVSELEEMLQKSVDGGVFYLENIKSKKDMNSPHDRSRAISEGEAFLKKLPTNLQDGYKELFSKIFKIEFEKIGSYQKIDKFEKEKISKESFQYSELSLLKALLENRELISMIEDSMFVKYSNLWNDLKNGVENTEFTKISLMDFNLDKKELKIEIVNFKILSLLQNRRNLKSLDEMREFKHTLTHLEKQKRKLLSL